MKSLVSVTGKDPVKLLIKLEVNIFAMIFMN